MQAFKKFSVTAVVILVVLALGYFVFANYSYVFSKVVEGRIIGVERITQPTAVLGATTPSEALFSFAIEDAETKKVFTASSEDRQWGVAKYCTRAKVRFYPYPFWNFEKSGTYFNARVEELFDCQKADQPVPTPTPGL
jgi:hypothetical protein